MGCSINNLRFLERYDKLLLSQLFSYSRHTMCLGFVFWVFFINSVCVFIRCLEIRRMVIFAELFGLLKRFGY